MIECTRFVLVPLFEHGQKDRRVMCFRCVVSRTRFAPAHQYALSAAVFPTVPLSPCTRTAVSRNLDVFVGSNLGHPCRIKLLLALENRNGFESRRVSVSVGDYPRVRFLVLTIGNVTCRRINVRYRVCRDPLKFF